MNVKYSKIACIILASGVGRRFGANKPLTAIDGAPMLQHILDISQGLFAKRIVVTRHKDVAEICAQQQIPCLLHDKPYLSDTVRLGTSYIQQQSLSRGPAFCRCRPAVIAAGRSSALPKA